MHWRWRLADTEPDRPSLRVRVHIGRTEPWPRIDEVGNQSCGKTNHCPSPLTTDEGFIPAHAGKTISLPASTVASWLHPRSRGENQDVGVLDLTNTGSSPLTRGKLSSDAASYEDAGLIPAHAGKTASAPAYLLTHRAHPRSRGENYRYRTAKPRHPGSSPLTRGKPFPVSHRRCADGLIPAHAGKTNPGPHLRANRRAHPRSRGENLITLGVGGTCLGSSPLTRGKRALVELAGLPGGLIPAHAGKTGHTDSRRCSAGAHPRSRGENISLAGAWHCPSGSSPLTRGKPCGRAHALVRERLIPAHAGKTR